MEEIRKSMRQITRMAQAYTARAFHGSDLSPSQMQALRTVCFHDGISQQELANHLGIDKAAVARIITVLEAKAYVTRGTDSKDGRIKRLTATDSGMALKNALIASEAAFYQHIFAETPPEDMAVFLRVLEAAHHQAHSLRRACYAPLLPQQPEDASTGGEGAPWA